MREIFTHQDYTRVGYFKSVLDEAGIPAFIRNEHTNNTMAGMPSHLFFPSLCVINDEDYEEALALIQPLLEPAVPSQEWTCPNCAEPNPGNFELCWNCGAEKPPDKKTGGP